MRRVSAVMCLYLMLALVAPRAQFGVIGRSLGRAVPAPTTPCDLVSGCVAAWSVQRRMLATYAGALFQLTKTGGSTQDIGQTAGGLVDMSAIATFCGSTSGSGRSTTTTNTCQFTKVYDQTGNANHLQALDANGGGGCACLPCPTPYSVNASGKPIVINATSNTCFYGDHAPTGLTAGDVPLSVYVAANDTYWPVESVNYNYSLNFGVMHPQDVMYNLPGSDFDITLRGGPATDYPTCAAGCSDFLSVGVDLETDVFDVPYGASDHDLVEAALSQNVASYARVGDFVAAITYSTSTTNIIVDFQNGLRTETAAYASHLNVGGGGTPELREGYTGDGTSSNQGSWYEGAVITATLTLAQLQSLESSGQTFYGITRPPTCTAGGIDLIGGATVVTGAWGLRQLDPTRPAPLAVIARVSDNTLLVLGTTAGNCTPNYTALNTFCSGTTCHLYDLINNVLSVTEQLAQWTGRVHDPTRLTSAASLTSGLTYTPTALNTSLPVMSFGTGLVLTSLGTTNAVTRPWSILAAVQRTSTSGGSFFTDGAGTNILGGGSANLLQVTSSSGTFTASSTDSTWHAVAGMTPTNTSIMACVNGTCTTSGAVTTGNTASSTWKLGSNFSGAMTEVYLVNGTAVSSTAAAALSTVQRAIGGY